MTTDKTGPKRQERAQRARVLRERGHTWEQIADVYECDYPQTSPRVAFRWARNISHQEVADQWNSEDEGIPTMVKSRIYQYEAWPQPGGRRPSVDHLSILARIYQTTARRLLTDNEYTLYSNSDREQIESIDYRSLDEAFIAVVRTAMNMTVSGKSVASTEAPVMLITRPKIVHPVDGKSMLLVGEGTFPAGAENEAAYLPAFYMDATLVTNDDYANFVSATGYKPPPHWEGGKCPEKVAEHPVVNVSHCDASAYAEWAGKRLPNILEWEKAARGEKGYLYPWGDRAAVAKCNVRESRIGGTTSVGRYQSGISPYGIYDMSGNVWEWCSTQTMPGRYVLKGSAWTSPFEMAQTTAINDASEQMYDDDTGFRCVTSPDALDTAAYK